MVNLETKLGPLTLQNPVTTASGTFGYGIEYEPYLSLDNLGAITLKGTTILTRLGNNPCRIAETPSGMLNAVGLQNDGVDYLISNYLPQLEKYKKLKVIINVSGNTVEEYCQVIDKLNNQKRVDAIELNISCPNVKFGGMAFGTSKEAASGVVKEARKITKLPLIVKLSPNVTDVVGIGEAVMNSGGDILSLVNTFLGMAVDVAKKQPVLSTITGGLSGPAIKPIALRMVWQVKKALKVPIIGMGGIDNTTDALEFIMAGADAISVGTANFRDPQISEKIVDGLRQYCLTEKIPDLSNIRGII